MAEILLIGGGGHCRSVISAILSSGEKVAGIIDPETSRNILGIKVIGTDADLPSLIDKGYEFIITVGCVDDCSVRAGIYERTISIGISPRSFIAGSALVGKDVSIGTGTVVLEGAVVNAGSTIGTNCIINTRSVIEHDASIGNHVHIATGAILCGGVTIGDLSLIGAGSTIIQGVTIGTGSIVAAGSTVTGDVEDNVLVAGSPARAVRTLKTG